MMALFISESRAIDFPEGSVLDEAALEALIKEAVTLDKK
jgi:hypothetical protein